MFGEERILLASPFQLFISVGFLLFSAVFSQIPLGSKLSVVGKNYWASSSGNFAIGFFNHSDQYSVGIHFNSNFIPTGKQVVVWVPGADLTVGSGSYFQLTQSGALVLFDSTLGGIAWTSNTANLSVVSAVLLDTGNLVLLNRKKEIVWQSFDTPTDTLLPGQNLSASQILRGAARNSVSSYYSLHFNALGQLQLRWKNDVVYWTSGSHSQSNPRAILRSDGTLQLLDQRSKVVWSVFGEDHDDQDVKFRLLRLDVDGNFRLYSWINISWSWRPVWQAVENQCEVFATCDLSGICVFNASSSPVCRCPFTPATEPNSKCLVPYRQDCKSGSIMNTYNNTLLYGIYPPNKTITTTSLQQCKSLCQEDQHCTAATFANDGTAQCQITNSRYITGQSEPSLSSISFVKSCSDPTAGVLPRSLSSSSAHNASLKRSNRICVPCLIGVASGTFIVFFLIQFGIGFFVYKRRNNYIRTKAALAYAGPYSKGLITLSYPEIKDLTENFKNQIGPKMFKGMLPDNRPVAVKDLKAAIEGRKFRSTVMKIGIISHKNLVRLEGYCCESDHRLLVFEFVKNGSLRRCIEDHKLSTRLTWKKRMEICLTVAKAISYLHTGCREFICHGNLKCENVFLDENLDAKVSEFGLGRLQCEASDSGGGAAEKDVKDFGKMVVALLSGRGEGDDVCRWAYENWVTGEGENVVDGRIGGGVSSEELERGLRIAFWCLQVDEEIRPSIGEVIKVLEGTLAADPPPSPFISRRAQVEEESSDSGPEP